MCLKTGISSASSKASIIERNPFSVFVTDLSHLFVHTPIGKTYLEQRQRKRVEEGGTGCGVLGLRV